jgi:hypothetical protein
VLPQRTKDLSHQRNGARKLFDRSGDVCPFELNEDEVGRLSATEKPKEGAIAAGLRCHSQRAADALGVDLARPRRSEPCAVNGGDEFVVFEGIVGRLRMEEER